VFVSKKSVIGCDQTQARHAAAIRPPDPAGGVRYGGAGGRWRLAEPIAHGHGRRPGRCRGRRRHAAPGAHGPRALRQRGPVAAPAHAQHHQLDFILHSAWR